MQKNEIDIRFRNGIVFNVAIKGLSILLGLITVNIYLSYLGSSNYGLWITISSIASWAAMGDLGIGNGLRNELAKAYANNDTYKQQELISTAVSTLTKVSAAILILLSATSEVLIYFGILEHSVRGALYVTNIFMCINLVLGIFSSVAYSYQMSYYPSLSQLVYTGLQVFIVWLLVICGAKSNLLLFAIVNGASNMAAHGLLIFALRYKTKLMFHFRKVNPVYRKSIMGIGTQFFILQLCGLVLYSTDTVIIKGLFGNDQVTAYSIITKVFDTGDALFSILLISLWSAVTYQYSLKNFRWITDKIKGLLKIWVIYSAGVVFVAVFFNAIIRIWLRQNAIEYGFGIIGIFAIYSIAGRFGAIYGNVANGMGIIKLQLLMSVIEAVLNVPLSIFLATFCGMGIMGVKAATLVCNTGANIVIPIYISRLLRNKLKSNEGRDT